VALVLSTFAFDFFFLPPLYSIGLKWRSDPYLVWFLLFASLAAWFGAARRRSAGVGPPATGNTSGGFLPTEHARTICSMNWGIAVGKIGPLPEWGNTLVQSRHSRDISSSHWRLAEQTSDAPGPRPQPQCRSRAPIILKDDKRARSRKPSRHHFP